MSIETLIAEIEAEIARLEQARTLLSGTAAPTPKKRGRPAGVVKAAAAKPVKKKRKLSPEGRARLIAAVKARWAKQKQAAKETAPPAKKRRMSAVARKRIAEAQKKRWAAIRVAKKAVKPSPAKKAAKKAPANEAILAKKAARKKAPGVKAKEVVPEKAAPSTAEAAPS
jgi:hypothetical protein